jgi:hypothetical protein
MEKILIGIGERCFIKCASVDKDHCIGMMFDINGGPHLEFRQCTLCH